MHSDRLFPMELLEQPVEARLGYFANLYIAHPHLLSVLDTLLDLLTESDRPRVICVIGVSGVGKSVLLRAVEQRLLQTALPAMEQDPGLIPVTNILASAESERFSWKEFDSCALRALREPLIEYKLNEDEYTRKGMGRKAPSESTIRRVLENCCHYRRTRAILIDEGQHLCKVRDENQLLEQAENIYNRAVGTSATYILFGTYELYPLAQALRSIDQGNKLLHFPIYHRDSGQDVGYFRDTLYTFQQHCPFPGKSDLIADIGYFFNGAVGCVGLLKDWLLSAVDAALQDDAPQLSRRYLDEYVSEPYKRWSIVEESTKGEEILRLGGLKNQLNRVMRSNIAVKTKKPGYRKPTNDSTKRRRQVIQ